jgi:hypothetical protein
MYSPIHATAGLLIATVMPDPMSAALAGIASHYLLDVVPHGDTHFGAWLTGGHAKRRILTVESVDLGLGIMVVLALLLAHPEQSWIKLVAGAIGGVLPDLLWGFRFVVDSSVGHIPFLTSALHAHDRWHSWGHAKHAYDIPFTVGLLLQALVLGVVLFLQLK